MTLVIRTKVHFLSLATLFVSFYYGFNSSSAIMNSPLFKLIFVAYGLDKHVKMYLGEYIKRFLTKIN